MQTFPLTTNKNIKMSSFKSSENIQKKEGGQDRSVSDAHMLTLLRLSLILSLILHVVRKYRVS